jgi:hypothetical protein
LATITPSVKKEKNRAVAFALFSDFMKKVRMIMIPSVGYFTVVTK